eukprot:jgi/Psemu1/283817/fgenesh1_pg.34_\
MEDPRSLTAISSPSLAAISSPMRYGSTKADYHNDDVESSSGSYSAAASPYWTGPIQQSAAKRKKASSGFSSPVAFCFTINYILGAGFLTIPWAFVQSGLVLSSIMLIVSAFGSDIAKDYMLETMSRAEVMLDDKMHWKKHEKKWGGATNENTPRVLLRPPAKIERERLLQEQENQNDCDENGNIHKTLSFQSLQDAVSRSNLGTTLQGRGNRHVVVIKPKKYIVKDRKFEMNSLCRVFLGKRGLHFFTLVLSLYMVGTLWAYTSVFSSAMARAFPVFSVGDITADDSVFHLVAATAASAEIEICNDLNGSFEQSQFLSGNTTKFGRTPNNMRIQTAFLLLFVASSHEDNGVADAFSMMPKPMAAPFSLAPSSYEVESSTALFGKRRTTKSKKKQSQGRSNQFYEAIEDANGKEVKGAPEASATATATPPRSPQQQEAMDEAQKRYEQRPEVTTMVVDEASGTEFIAQGQKVMDVVTRKAVKLSNLGADARLAQMFPGVPPEVREKYRVDWKTIEVPQLLDLLKDACMTDVGDGQRGIPVHPSLTNKGIDFILSNRDRLGYRMSKTIPRWTFSAASKGNMKEAKEVWNKLHINFLTMENYISGPFRQIMQDAEGRVGPNFGNLELLSFCDGDLYQRVGNYLVLKGMVAHWEKKVVDADFLENSDEDEIKLYRGDPKRYLRKDSQDAPILYTLKECTQVCAMAQQMCKLFVEEEKLFGDFPPEVVFLEESLKIKGGTALRKYMIDEFCPSRGITPDALREGVKRLGQQLDNMQIDPYADITMKIEQLYAAMAVGSDDARDPYAKYLGFEASDDPNNPAYFETYTFNHAKKSLVRFMDDTYPSVGGISEMIGPPPAKDESASAEKSNPFEGLANGLNNLMGQIQGERTLRVEPTFDDDTSTYVVPKERAVGRSHDQKWFEELNADDGDKKDRFGKMEPGRIIPDE